MKLFGSRQSPKPVNDQVPEEVRSFREAERRERLSLAWVLGIVSLLILIVIFVMLFFAGRWAYNKITDSDSPDTSQVTTVDPDSEKGKAEKDKKQAEAKKKEQAAAKQKEQAAAQNQDNSSNNTTLPDTTPRTGPSAEEALPRTGPDLDL